MRFFLAVFACFLCVNLTLSVKNTFKAAVVLKKEVEPASYVHYIKEAAKLNVDVLVLSSPEDDSKAEGVNDYDEAVKTLSNAAKQNSLYVIAHLLDNIRCQRVNVIVRNNLVFGRDGAIVSSYRKPVHDLPNCTISDPGLHTFTTDFGVTFGLLMEEDLILQNVEMTKRLKNFVAVGDFASDIAFLSASRFSPAWAYVTKANLISCAGIYSGRAGNVGVSSANNMMVAELNKDGGSENKITPPIVSPSSVHTFPGEDLSQYIIRPLNLEASAQGYQETVCFGDFCCDFDVKTRFVGSQRDDPGYGLAVFRGRRGLGAGRGLGARACALAACAGRHKRRCRIGSSNDTNVEFERLSISANFTDANSAQFPIIVSGDSKFKFESETVKSYRKVSFVIENAKNMWSFGIFGRDYSSDLVKYIELDNANSEGLTLDIYEYFYSEEVIEFFDYLWIRLRILIVVVSIYFLEMM